MDGVRMARTFFDLTILAHNNAFKTWKASGMSAADFTEHLVASVKELNAVIAGDCAKQGRSEPDQAARAYQSAIVPVPRPKARVTNGGKFHPESYRLI